MTPSVAPAEWVGPGASLSPASCRGSLSGDSAGTTSNSDQHWRWECGGGGGTYSPREFYGSPFWQVFHVCGVPRGGL